MAEDVRPGGGAHAIFLTHKHKLGHAIRVLNRRYPHRRTTESLARAKVFVTAAEAEEFLRKCYIPSPKWRPSIQAVPDPAPAVEAHR